MANIRKRVAVIGAGVSGVVTAKHLVESGLEVVVFERSRTSGGNWTFDERKPLEPRYPSTNASSADFVLEEVDAQDQSAKAANSLKDPIGQTILQDEEAELAFAPPGPAYSGLTNNVSTRLQTLKGHPWPEGTPDYVNVRVKQEYISSYSKAFGVEPLIQYNTRVEKLQKVGSAWKVRTTTMTISGPEKGKKTQSTDEFESVVIASGHYHASRVPDIPGLKEWKRKWPDRVEHSKRYRHAQDFKDQTVLLIGAGTSSTDIARECVNIAKKVYQSSRGGDFDIPLSFLPSTAERVAGIKSFKLPSEGQQHPGSVTLTDGTVLSGIDRVVICTGYLFSLPFLPELHDDYADPLKANDTILVTDGAQLHNLHKDIFYILDPTLVFVGVPFYTATYNCFEYQAITVAAVLSGRAWLPSKEEMRAEYEERVKQKGYGRHFHSLKGVQVEYVSELTAWLNSDAEISGGQKVGPHSEEWKAEEKIMFEKLIKFWDTREKLQNIQDDAKATST